MELMAMKWLRFEKRCLVALRERSPRYNIGLPDVLGITKTRYLLEIEIKRSVSDFKADAKKPHRANRHLHLNKMPKQFWYLTPASISEQIEKLVPEWAGLMRMPTDSEVQQVKVMKSAPSNELSERLTAKEMMKLGHCMANHLLSSESAVQSLLNRMSYLNGNLYDPEYQI